MANDSTSGCNARRRGGRPLRGGPDQSGVVAIELAILLPFLALLIVGTFEVGLWAREHQVLENAAREGARYSALPANNMSSATAPGAARTRIENVVIRYLASEGIEIVGGDITINQNVPIQIGQLTVQASQIDIAYRRPVFWGLLGFLDTDTVTLTGRAIFRNFY